MEASIVDLRYKMKDVLKALKRQETVKVYYRNTLCGILTPVESSKKMNKKIKDHPFYGMHRDASNTVEDEMNHLRGDRYKELKDVI
jgi:hypothetical protein